MRISLIVIGKTSTPWLKQGIDEYVKRLARYAPFQYVELPDVKLRNARITHDQLKAAEAPVLPLLNQPDYVDTQKRVLGAPPSEIPGDTTGEIEDSDLVAPGLALLQQQ